MEQSTVSEPSIHDSFVCEIVHRLEDRVLMICSHYRDSEIPKPYLVTTFTNVVAHHFDYVVAPSILLDIMPLDVATVIEMNKGLFANGLGQSWPFHGPKTLQELASELTLASINGYQVLGSCGMDGFVLASACTIQAFAEPQPLAAWPGS